MSVATRTPSKWQAEVLAALVHLQDLDGTMEPISYTTGNVLNVVREHAEGEASLATVIKALNGCVRHEWVKVRTTGIGVAPRGENLAWAIQPDGIEAFRLAESAAATTQETNMEATTAPVAPWDTTTDPDPEDTATPIDEEALSELDDEDTVHEGELEDPGPEDDNPPVNEQSNQLTLAIGGPKPKSSILKIMSKQQKFGSTRQFKNMERIPFSGYLEIRGVAIDVQANGFVQRLQKAVISELVIDGIDVSDNDSE